MTTQSKTTEQKLAESIDQMLEISFIRKKFGKALVFRRDLLLSQESTPQATLDWMLDVFKTYLLDIQTRQNKMKAALAAQESD